MVDRINQTEDILCHHGVIGQKWGIRRYQNKDGSLTSEGRKHWGIGEKLSKTTKNAKLKLAKTTKNAKLKLAKAKKAKDAHDAKAIAEKKAKLLAKGDAAAIHKNRALFSDAELDTAMKRITKLQDLQKMDPKQKEAMEKLQQTQKNRQTVKEGKSTTDKLMAAGKTAIAVVGVAASLYQSYNKIAGMINAISGSEVMPQFDLNPWNRKDSSKDNNQQGQDSNKNNKDNNQQGQDSNKNNKGNNQQGQDSNKNNKGNNQQGQNSSTDNYKLKFTGNKDTYNAEDLADDFDLSFTPTSWNTTSTAKSDWTSTSSTTDGMKKNWFQNVTSEGSSIFDLDNGYMDAQTLKDVAKGKKEADPAMNTFISLYSAEEKAKNVTFEDLAAPDLWRPISSESNISGTTVKVKKSDDSPYEIVRANIPGEDFWGTTQSDYEYVRFDNNGNIIR